MTLIKNKSGANLHVLPKSSDQYCELSITGSPGSLVLAGSMIQEALTGGLNKIHAMPDAPFTGGVSVNYSNNNYNNHYNSNDNYRSHSNNYSDRQSYKSKR